MVVDESTKKLNTPRLWYGGSRKRDCFSGTWQLSM